MSVSDPVADMLTKIRNASNAKLEKVDVVSSRFKTEVIKILKSEGYIKNFKRINEGNRNVIRIYLKYDSDNNAVIHGIHSVSTPGRRAYFGYRNMPRVYNGYGTVIVSTSTGVLTGKKATLTKVGGEVICKVW